MYLKAVSIDLEAVSICFHHMTDHVITTHVFVIKRISQPFGVYFQNSTTLSPLVIWVKDS